MKKLQSKTDNINTHYYLVKYCGGSYDDYYNKVIFVTDKKSTATQYVTKFNKILKTWKKYYEQFEITEHGMRWIAKKHVDKHFDRWYKLQSVTKCYYEEVPFR